MTNPDNAIGTNAAYNGRTSVNAFNDVLSALSRGVVNGWVCKPSSGMTVALGGDGTTRDVAVAEDNVGNKVSINNISGSPVLVTLSAAPGTNSRIDAIVAYVDAPAKGSADQADNPNCCGIIAVSGTAASSPNVPGDSAIRSAITSDGAKVTTSLTTITQDNITVGTVAKLTGKGVVGSDNVDFTTSAMLPPATFTGNRASNNASYGDMTGTYTIPEDGLYELYTHAYSASAGGTNFSMSIKALINSGNLFERTGIVATPNYAGNHFANFDCTLSFWASKGDVIKLQSLVAEAKWTGRISHSSRVKRLV